MFLSQIFEIAKARHRKSAEEICTFLNSCLLPKTADKAKVREQEEPLEKTGTKKLWKLNHSERLKEQKKSALKIVQLTDIHIEPDYAEVGLIISICHGRKSNLVKIPIGVTSHNYWPYLNLEVCCGWDPIESISVNRQHNSL